MNNGTYDAFATIWGMKMYHLLVANRERTKPGAMLARIPGDGPGRLAPVHRQRPVHRDMLDPFGPAVSVALSCPPPRSLRAEEQCVRRERLLDGDQASEAGERLEQEGRQSKWRDGAPSHSAVTASS